MSRAQALVDKPAARSSTANLQTPFAGHGDGPVRARHIDDILMIVRARPCSGAYGIGNSSLVQRAVGLSSEGLGQGGGGPQIPNECGGLP